VIEDLGNQFHIVNNSANNGSMGRTNPKYPSSNSLSVKITQNRSTSYILLADELTGQHEKKKSPKRADDCLASRAKATPTDSYSGK
jgi:hypothetical protein